MISALNQIQLQLALRQKRRNAEDALPSLTDLAKRALFTETQSKLF